MFPRVQPGLKVIASLIACGLHADCIPHCMRVQPGLKVLLYVCEPLTRLHSLERRLHSLERRRAASSTPNGDGNRERDLPNLDGNWTREALAQLATLNACTTHEPLPTCAARLAAANPIVDGLYGVWLRALLRALPAAQLRVLRAEDEARAPTRALREAWRFFGLRELPNLDDGALGTALGAALGTAPLAPSRGDEGERPALKTALETGALAALAAFYREHSAELVQLMDGDERFAWGAAA